MATWWTFSKSLKRVLRNYILSNAKGNRWVWISLKTIINWKLGFVHIPMEPSIFLALGKVINPRFLN
jgi:hypothetical protein